jgi:hypothetical protein
MIRETSGDPPAREHPRVRVETDALGAVNVPAEHLWGAQTERSRHNFHIGVERYRLGRPVILKAAVQPQMDTDSHGSEDKFPHWIASPAE